MSETDYWTHRITKRETAAVGITCLIAWTCTYLAIKVLNDYAFGLFIWLPIVMGACSTMIYGYKNPTPRQKLRNISYWTLLFYCLGLMAFALEGAICIIMVAPIGMFFTWVGYRIGHEIVVKHLTNPAATIILLFLSVPLLMSFESAQKDKEAFHSVTTSIEINASPEKVWKSVIAFPQLKEPTEFIFKTGIAYPINATINGQGVGAVRHCNFSTGSFVEPITVWNEPYLLKFSVVEQPEPMKELSFYNIHPNHLHGYWISKEGQFKLTKLSNGHTQIEGTTWYSNKIKPDFYWSLWSNYIVHKIHKRVLEHIKTQAELL